MWQGKQCQGKQTKEHVWGLAKQLGAQNRKEQVRRKMSLVAESFLSWASARSAGDTSFSLLRRMDLERFKPKFSLKDHTVRQENWVFPVCVFCCKWQKNEMVGQNLYWPKSIVVLLIPDPLGCQEDIKTLNLHTAFSLWLKGILQILMATLSPCSYSLFFVFLSIRHLMHQFVFVLQTVSSCVRGLSHKVMCREEMPKEISSISSPFFKDYFS